MYYEVNVMDNLKLLNWLYSDIDELIDFEGYIEERKDENFEREKHNEACSNNAGPICNNT